MPSRRRGLDGHPAAYGIFGAILAFTITTGRDATKGALHSTVEDWSIKAAIALSAGLFTFYVARLLRN